MNDLNSAVGQAKAQLESIIEMVEALTEAEGHDNDDAREEAERAIHEDALEVSVRSDWYSLGADTDEMKPTEYRILLCTGGPAVQIIGTLNTHGEPVTAQLQCQDWFQPWNFVVTTEDDKAAMLRYAQCFYFGD
jgi:hypothetical protein